jgi:hypothetical protein
VVVRSVQPQWVVRGALCRKPREKRVALNLGGTRPMGVKVLASELTLCEPRESVDGLSSPVGEKMLRFRLAASAAHLLRCVSFN